MRSFNVRIVKTLNLLWSPASHEARLLSNRRLLVTLAATALLVAAPLRVAAVSVNLPIAEFETIADPDSDAQADQLFSWQRILSRVQIIIGNNTPALLDPYSNLNPTARSRLELDLAAAPAFNPTASSLIVFGNWQIGVPFEESQDQEANMRDHLTVGGQRISFDQLAAESTSFRECADNADDSGCEFSLRFDDLSSLIDQDTNRIILETDYADGDTLNQLGDAPGEPVFELTTFQLVAPSVRGVHVFYNDSALDGNGLAVDPNDFAAIAPDKSPLRFGQTATTANISGFSRGVNGLFIDFDNLPGDGAAIAADDFALTTGNNDFPETWSPVEPSGVGILPGMGEEGADRVYLTLPDGQIANTWLRLTVKANDDTGLGVDDDFFFGAAPGETGAGFLPGVVGVDAADLQSIGNDITPLAEAGTVPSDNPNDVNRDRTVNAFDLQAVAGNLDLNAINNITPQLGAAAAATAVPEPTTGALLAVLIGVVAAFTGAAPALRRRTAANPAP